MVEALPTVERNHTGGLLSGIYLLAIVNCTALNTCVPAFVWTPASNSKSVPRSGGAGSDGDVLLDLWRGHSTTTRYHSQLHTEIRFLLALTNTCYFACFCSYPLKLSKSSIWYGAGGSSIRWWGLVTMASGFGIDELEAEVSRVFLKEPEFWKDFPTLRMLKTLVQRTCT